MKTLQFTLLISATLLLAACNSSSPTANVNPPDRPVVRGGVALDPGPIGGERDENGCLGPAGYSYDEAVKACTRPWEIKEDTSKAATIAVENFGATKGLTVISIETLRCPGCFTVNLDLNQEQSQVKLENWEVTK